MDGEKKRLETWKLRMGAIIYLSIYIYSHLVYVPVGTIECFFRETISKSCRQRWALFTPYSWPLRTSFRARIVAGRAKLELWIPATPFAYQLTTSSTWLLETLLKRRLPRSSSSRTNPSGRIVMPSSLAPCRSANVSRFESCKARRHHGRKVFGKKESDAFVEIVHPSGR